MPSDIARIGRMSRMFAMLVPFTLLACSSQKPKPAEPSPGVANAQIYSCFTFAMKASTGGTSATQNACMRTVECEDYRSEVITADGVADISECAGVASLFCFHHAASEKVPAGADVCQPSLDECQAERSKVVAAGTPVDTDCAPR
jgi:hypothetical protein